MYNLLNAMKGLNDGADLAGSLAVGKGETSNAACSSLSALLGLAKLSSLSIEPQPIIRLVLDLLLPRFESFLEWENRVGELLSGLTMLSLHESLGELFVAACFVMKSSLL